MESLGYVLVYFLKGSLPWQNLKAKDKKDKYEKIMEKKLTTALDVLCQDLPPEFITYLAYCRNLKFDEKPDYAFLKKLFKDLFEKLGFEYDNIYDWKIDMDPKNGKGDPAQTGMAVIYDKENAGKTDI